MTKTSTPFFRSEVLVRITVEHQFPNDGANVVKNLIGNNKIPCFSTVSVLEAKQITNPHWIDIIGWC